KGFIGLLGKITPVPSGQVSRATPLPEKLVNLRETRSQQFTFETFAGDLPAVRRVVEQARLASQLRLPLLLVGEEGAGKHWLARPLHEQGTLRERAFVALDCARLPPEALADLLVGEERPLDRIGAGTVYLQEPAGLPRDLQLRLSDALAAGVLEEQGP